MAYPDSEVLIDLTHEWTTSLADEPLGPWAGEPLAGCDTAADVLTITTRQHSTHNDRVLIHLLTAHQAGYPQAGRLVLQMMLPKISSIAHRNRYRDDADANTLAVSAAWEAITTYPLHRTTHVAACIGFAVIRHLADLRTPHQHETVVSHETWEALDQADDGTDVLRTLATQIDPGCHDPSPSELVIHLVRWALRNSIISQADARMLAAVHCHADDMAQYAEQTGRTHAAVRQHHSRVIRKLRAGMADQGLISP